MRQALYFAAAVSALAAPALAGGDMAAHPPANARPGQCFGRVQAPGGVVRSRERVLVRPAGSEQRWVPAVTRWTEKRELVKPAWVETIRQPAVYRTEVDYVLTPGARHVVQRPGRYRRVVERVLVAPARTVWRPGRAAAGFGGGDPGAYSLQPTGEILCRVRIPARYATRVRLIQVAAPCSCEVEAPPVRHRIEKQVLVRPASEAKREHAAVYRTRRICEIVKPGHAYTVAIPAQYRTVEHARHITRQGWSPVVCQNGLSAPAMARLQQSLSAQGYDAGPADGVGSPRTFGALRRYQRDHRLAEGQVTVESARALGVIR